ncbi:MAG: hypothetical protein HY958_01510 [Bacteroidia bacterium]|nr:hypothetical protein [Bacteroidia bacterium]
MILLKEVYDSFQQKQYKKALRQFKQAKIMQEQSGVAKQLKAEIINQLALEYFHELRFGDCIDLLQSNFVVQAKPEFPIPVERSRVIAGMCYLYLSDFPKASDYLKTSIHQTETHPYYYYYLLSEIYRGVFLSYKDFKNLQAEYENYLSNIPSEKLLYLEAMFYLQKGETAKFVKTIKKAKPESVSQQINFSFLSYINLKKKKVAHSTSLKPLYKIINQTAMSSVENIYLLSVPGLNDYIIENEQAEMNRTQSEDIRNLCIHGEPLNDSTFNSIINDLHLEYGDQIIFNQISALIAHRPEQKKEEHPSDIRTQKAKYVIIENFIKKHRNVFFSFPESLNTYISFSANCILSDAYSFYENIFLYIGKHKDTLNDYKYEAICLNAASVHRMNFPQFNIDGVFNKFMKIKANLLGLFFFNALSYISGNKKIYDDIPLTLSNPIINELGAKEFVAFFHFFKVLIEDHEDFEGYFFRERIKEFFFATLNREIPLSLSNKAILNLHNALNDFVIEFIIFNEYSPDKNDRLYIEFNLKRLKYFKEDKESSAFYENFKFIEFCTTHNELKHKLTIRNLDDIGNRIIEIVRQNNVISFFNIALKILNIQDGFWGITKTQSIKNLIYEIYKVIFEVKTDKELQNKFASFLNGKFENTKSNPGVTIQILLLELINKPEAKNRLIIFKIFMILSEPYIANQEYFFLAYDFLKFSIKIPNQEALGEEKISFIKKLLGIYESRFILSKNKSHRQLYNQIISKFSPDKPLLEIITNKPKKKNIDKRYNNLTLFD